jgi:hypothetical protein
MKVEDIRSLKIELTDPEAELFVGIIKKMEDQCKQPGFHKRIFTPDESEFITRLSERFTKGSNQNTNDG